MTQHQKIMELLNDNNWHCTNEFYANYMADPRKRLNELRAKGVEMEWRWCKAHKHGGQSKEWRLKQNESEIEIVKRAFANFEQLHLIK